MKAKPTEVRIDKYLWAVRIFKTRALATEACKKGRVVIDNVQVKPSRNIRQHEIIEIKNPPIVRTYKVLDLLEKRQSAKIVVDFVEEITPQEEFDKLKMIHEGSFIHRHKGLGRPTKKDRREIGRFLDND